MFQITDSASKQFKQASQELGEPELSLRIAARTTPDQGIMYKLGFDSSKEGDVTYDINGISVLVDQESDKLVDSMIIDYRMYHDQEQFVFVNPNDSTQCKDEGEGSQCDPNKSACKSCMGG